MNKTIRLALAGCAMVTAVTLVGCAGQSEDAGATEDKAFIASLDRGAVPHPNDAQAIGLGRSACAQLDAGANFTSVGFTVMSTGLEAEQAGYLIGSAVGVFCPQHLETLKAAAEQY
jgi:Protein of unknown function (DUF732)